MIPLLVLISLYNIIGSEDSSLFLSRVLDALFVILSCHILGLNIRRWRTKVDSGFEEDMPKVFITSMCLLGSVVNDCFREIPGLEMRNNLIFLCTQIFVLSIADMLLQVSSKSKLERNLIAKEHKASLGFGLAKCNFSFLENVIKGKKQTPPLSEQLTEYCRTQRLEGGQYWICQKVLILFPEGNYPYLTNGETWGTMEDILKNKYDKETVKAVRERPEYTYTVSGCIQRTSVLDIVRVVKDDTWHYAAYVENRPLTSLCKLVDCPISLESGNAEVLVTKEDFKIHFQVYKRELERLLQSDLYCRDKYEIVHYRENEKRSFADKVIGIFDSIKSTQESCKPCPNIS